MILRDELHLGVAAGEQDPAVQTVTRGEVREIGDGIVPIRAGPDEVALHVARQGRQGIIVGDEPDRDAAPAEAARDFEAAVSAAEDECALRGGAAHRCGCEKAGDNSAASRFARPPSAAFTTARAA